ncbi:MAG: cytidine deaminase [Clostridiales bacterium]|nr:cytidine deaminase [Clostridiales bacterium]
MSSRTAGEDGGQMIKPMDMENLICAADQARQNAYAPYSRFHVGAAVLCADGTVFTGCNIENASYPVSNCAERTALFKAVSEGYREFKAIAVISDAEGFTSPCGVCRQALSEFCEPELVIYMCGRNRKCRQTTLGELLPFAFSL